MNNRKPETIRVQKTDGTWLSLPCQAYNDIGPTLYVPERKGTWAIHSTGMIGNIGGNDWRIYTLHPDDCARICADLREPAPAFPAVVDC